MIEITDKRLKRLLRNPEPQFMMARLSTPGGWGDPLKGDLGTVAKAYQEWKDEPEYPPGFQFGDILDGGKGTVAFFIIDTKGVDHGLTHNQFERIVSGQL